MKGNICRKMSLSCLVVCLASPVWAGDRVEVAFPDLPGYRTLKCDFHMHTVYSDGAVLPAIRVREAWENGLDVIAITEHVEHQGKEGDVNKSDMNRSFELAKPEADAYHMLLIRGAEITRDLPHGHFNAIGIKDANPLNNKDNAEAIRLANEQGAVVFWNHPPELWSVPQEDYLQKGWVHGIEVFNGDTYYPHSFQWCLEKKLTVISNTDVHGFIGESYSPENGRHRTMTLVFAERTDEQGILEALRAGRTVGFWNNTLAGKQEWVEPLFANCVEVLTPNAVLKPRTEYLVALRNRSCVDFELSAHGRADGVKQSDSLRLPAGKTAMMTLSAAGDAAPGKSVDVRIPYRVNNVWVGPDKRGLDTGFNVHVTFE